ncbi:hypothetical protein GIB67_004244 [Kingdonia uniflora]|uniref:Uncharacterized protein n=1 Tax=Kingdonia uniflora TaxID=39325 RepID=A0A7J7MR05_9MAGN|nr:hypothetical protein GIB67_004244 [Kingdonia uniflora]
MGSRLKRGISFEKFQQNVKRGLWTSAEDAKILAHVSIHGPGLKRCGKSCRLRWTNYLRPDLNHNNFTPQEEVLIVRLHKAIGSRWSLIAMQLPGKTDKDVKNHWNTKLRNQLEHKAATNQETIAQQSHFFTADGSSSSSNVMQVTSPPPLLTRDLLAQLERARPSDNKRGR